MKFKIGRFQSSLGLTILLAAMALGFFHLGNWQRERAADKRAAQAAFDSAPRVTELGASTANWTRVRLRGQLDPQKHLLLDNKIHAGQAGVHVLTPLRLSDTRETVLVNRGWLPLAADRLNLPQVPTPAGDLALSGRLAPLSRPGVELGEPADLQADEWPQLMVYPDWARMEAALGHSLHRQVLYLDAASDAGFADRDWTPFTMGPDRHQAYAVQWYGLSLTALAAWLVLGFSGGRKSES